VHNQLDDTKNDVVRIIAREVREFLEATDLANEIKNAQKVNANILAYALLQ